MAGRLLHSKLIRWLRGCYEIYSIVRDLLAFGTATVLGVLTPVFAGQFFSLSSTQTVFLSIGIGVMAFALLLPAFRYVARKLSSETTEDEWYAMPKSQIVDKTYKNEKVELDGKTFMLCRFENVTFVYRGGAPFDLGTDNEITGSTSIEAPSPNLQGMIKLLATVGVLDPNLANFDPDLYKHD